MVMTMFDRLALGCLCNTMAVIVWHSTASLAGYKVGGVFAVVGMILVISAILDNFKKITRKGNGK